MFGMMSRRANTCCYLPCKVCLQPIADVQRKQIPEFCYSRERPGAGITKRKRPPKGPCCFADRDDTAVSVLMQELSVLHCAARALFRQRFSSIGCLIVTVFLDRYDHVALIVPMLIGDGVSNT